MSGIRVGSYVIITDRDRPGDEMIARIKKIIRCNGEVVLYIGEYLNLEFTGCKECCGSTPTLVSSFGRRLIWRGSPSLELKYKTVPNGKPCRATYRDGKPRKWQGA